VVQGVIFLRLNAQVKHDMAGPLVKAAKELLGTEDTPTVREQLKDGRLLEDHREQLQDRMDAGGCCNAATVAEATRRNGKEYR